MTNGGTTQGRDADERQAEGSKNNDEGGQVRKGAQVGSRASQSVADPLSLSLSLLLAPFSEVGHRSFLPGTAGVVTSSLLFSSSPPGPTGAPYNTCKWKLLKKKNPPLRGRRRRRRRETHSFGAAAERRVVNF